MRMLPPVRALVYFAYVNILEAKARQRASAYSVFDLKNFHGYFVDNLKSTGAFRLVLQVVFIAEIVLIAVDIVEGREI